MIQKPNSFTSYQLTQEEKEEAVKLNIVQKCYFQTLHADTAELLLGLKFTPDSIFNFAQEEAYYRGQLEILNFLLQQNAAVERSTLEQAREKVNSPQNTSGEANG